MKSTKIGNLFGKLSSSVARQFVHDEAAPSEIDHRLLPYSSKVTTAQQAVMAIKNGSHVFVGTACATPRALVAALEARRPAPADIELVHFLTDDAVPKDAFGQSSTQYRHRAFFVGRDIRAAVKAGFAEYVPLSLASVPNLIRLGLIPVDVALIQVSMPDEFGFVSLGVSVDITHAAVEQAKFVIAEVNPAMPRTMGDSSLHINNIDALTEVNTPVIEYQHKVYDEQVVERIARYISSIVQDGSTLQIGLGKFTNEAMKYLSDKKDLGIHSDVITDAIIALIESGVLTGEKKTHQPRKILTSFAMGSRRLYDLINNNPLFSFQPIDAICDPAVLAAQHRLVSVTQAFALDLTGQACVDQLDGEFYGGIAAQAEFMRAASFSDGGKAIICLASTDETNAVSSIRSTLNHAESATIARTDVHYVITEYGIAYLFGKSIHERAIALIQIAHPKFRQQLFDEAKQLGYLPPHQALKNLYAYRVEEEKTVTLRDHRQVLIRPVVATDVEGIRHLFHQLPELDVYTRFFQNVRSLAHEQLQKLSNVSFDNEVAFVAVTGRREHEVIVGHGYYVVDGATNMAETAFMVHPEWQNCGLGTALQNCLRDFAIKTGVRGFIADVIATNTKMILMAQKGFDKVSIEQEGATSQITVVFET